MAKLYSLEAKFLASENNVFRPRVYTRDVHSFQPTLLLFTPFRKILMFMLRANSRDKRWTRTMTTYQYSAKSPNSYVKVEQREQHIAPACELPCSLWCSCESWRYYLILTNLRKDASAVWYFCPQQTV